MMHYRNRTLWIDHYPVKKAVEEWGTPLYLYSKNQIKKNWDEFESHCKNQPHLICYAAKANSNLSLLKYFSSLGAGFDIVSQGELERVLLAGGDPEKIIFSGVGKSEKEIERALEVGIYAFNVESLPELERINFIAKKLNCLAPISMRVNPHISIKSHPYLTTGLKHNKFGVSFEQAFDAYRYAVSSSNLKVKGIACHLGSQITKIEPFLIALDALLKFADKLAKKSIQLEFIDIGGGLGIRYKNEKPVSIKKYLTMILKKMEGYPYRLIFEPGRSLIGNAGILVTKVEYIKKTKTKNFAIVDAAMNDLLRPALYEAWHNIIPVTQKKGRKYAYDVVGPVCETGDFLGLDRRLAIAQNDLLAICDVGAYGVSFSSNYNTRPRAAEVMITNECAELIRERETFEDIWKKEKQTL